MSSVRKKIYNILRGGFLTDDSSLKTWRMLFFIVVLLLIMISSSHCTDSKVVKIEKLKEKKRQIRAKYIETATALIQLKLESNIQFKVKNTGLKPIDEPPAKIKLTTKKNGS
ncbi:MAG: FtsL-like putative cell division protein [Tenacibaculum sp.]